jgi:hypothetical protein
MVDPVSLLALAGAGGGAAGVALYEAVAFACRLARRSRVTDLSLFWGMITVRRDPLDGEEILHDSQAESDGDGDAG